MLCLFPSLVLPHPGKTDRRGGHACRRDCSEWDLYIGEYHLHEADSRPVRVRGNDRAMPPVPPGTDSQGGTNDLTEQAAVPSWTTLAAAPEAAADVLVSRVLPSAPAVMTPMPAPAPDSCYLYSVILSLLALVVGAVLALRRKRRNR